MITRRCFNSRLLAASTGAAFALPLTSCSGPKPAYKLQVENGLTHMTSRAFGQDVSITTGPIAPERRTRIFDSIIERLSELEAIFDPHVATSELAQLNANGRLETPSAFLVALNQFSREMKILTNDTVNVAARPLHVLYSKSSEPDANDLAAALKLSTGYATGTQNRLRVTRPGTQIDFKAYLSGFVVDILSAQILGADISHALITTGEAHYAIGTQPDEKPWTIDLAAATLPLENAALVTSMPHKGTLIDPRVGALPALHERVSVIASQAVMADALCSAFSLMPIREISTRRAAILDGGLTQKLEIYVTDLSGQLVALRG